MLMCLECCCSSDRVESGGGVCEMHMRTDQRLCYTASGRVDAFVLQHGVMRGKRGQTYERPSAYQYNK